MHECDGMAARDADRVEYERKHVHEVYEDIASHFSSTRYKVWTCSGTSIGAAIDKSF